MVDCLLFACVCVTGACSVLIVVLLGLACYGLVIVAFWFNVGWFGRDDWFTVCGLVRAWL